MPFRKLGLINKVHSIATNPKVIMYPSTYLTAEQRADVHDGARHLAQHLRRAAIADFWQGVYRFATHALRTPQRASTRGTRAITATRQPTGV